MGNINALLGAAEKAAPIDGADKKYEIAYEEKQEDGRVLCRIKALKDFECHGRAIQRGDLGGWVKSERNLSKSGTCWIFDNAKVFDKSYVSGNASVSDNAKVGYLAQVCDNAVVRGNATVGGYAIVCQNAIVEGDSVVREKSIVSNNVIVRDNAIVQGCSELCDCIIDGDNILN